MTVAKEIELEDKFENMGNPDGARSRLEDEVTRAGDGTTTATVLTASIIKEGLQARRRRA